MIKSVAVGMYRTLNYSVLRTLTQTSKVLFIGGCVLLWGLSALAQVPNWSFEKGYLNAPNSAVYGTQGVAAADNLSGTRLQGASWKLGDKLYFFGGTGQGDSGTGPMNDLWEYNSTTGQWRWLKGSKTAGNQVGVYGTIGVESSSNNPGTRVNAVSWTANGKLYLFGGSGTGATLTSGYLNDLWRYDPATNNWTWIKGSNTTNGVGVYGTKGTAAPGNTPGSRFSSVGWEYQGKLYLFGGFGRLSTSSNTYYNDLWSFDTTTGTWTWVSGSNTGNASGVYGTKGIATTTNTPGSKQYATAWQSSGKLYLFGGQTYVNASIYTMNDLWEFDISTKLWRWLKGSNTASQYGVYGTKGVAAATNTPGSRNFSRGVEYNGSLYLFGGNGYALSTNGLVNDLWEYKISTDTWTWIKGSNLSLQTTVYGTQGVADAVNSPGSRQHGLLWELNGKIYHFGGSGYGLTTSQINLNDFWEYDISSTNWRWIKGSNRSFSVGIYGTKGIAAAANMPGPRNAHVTWAIGNKIYLFGGVGYANGVAPGTGNLNDLWEYDSTTKLWRWLKGSDVHNQFAVYGTQGVASATSTPGGRTEGTGWVHNDKLYFFGGNGYGANTGLHNDLWEYDPAAGNWKWLKNNTTNQVGVYGVQGTASASNRPGGRQGATSWISGDKAYLFGGSGYSSSTNGYLSDLWEYDMITGNWKWLEGTSSPNAPGVYGTKGTGTATTRPGGRFNSIAWPKDGKFYLFGGQGYSASSFGYLNDLWEYDVVSGNWRWLTGSNLQNPAGIYGTKGVPATTNSAGGRSNSSRWAIGNKLFMIGGTGLAATGTGSLNDVWEYNTQLGTWTWVKGSNIINQTGKLDPSGATSGNITGARNNSAISSTSTRAFMFGGTGFGTRGVSEPRGDLWAIDFSDKPLPVLSNFPDTLRATFGDADITPAAVSTNTSTPIVYSSDNESLASIVNGKIRIKGAGTVTISANQAESGEFSGQSIDQVLIISKGVKTITFNALATRKVGNPPFTLNATSPSETTITYTSSNPAVVSIQDNIATIVGAGTANITANQAEDDNYLAATPVMRPQLINAADVPDPAFTHTNSAINLTTTYGKASPTGSFSVSGSNLNSGVLVEVETPYSVSLDQVNYTNAVTVGTEGTLPSTLVYFRIDPNGAAGVYNSQAMLSTIGADTVMVSLGQGTVNPSPLTITALNGTKVYGTALYSTQESTQFTADSLRNDEQITSVTLAYMGGGNSDAIVNNYPGSITPSYPAGANGFYSDNYAITYATAALQVVPAPITVKADPISKQYGTSDPVLTYSITQGSLFGSDSFTGSLERAAGENAGVYPINQGTLLAGPNYAVTYSPSPFTITTSAPVVTFAPIGNVVFGQPNQPLTVNSSSSGTLTYMSSNPQVAVIVDGQLQIVGVGTTTITVSQAGNENYSPIEGLEQTITVNPAPASIVLTSLVHVYDGTAKPASASTNPEGITGLEISYNDNPDAPLAAGTYIVKAKLVNPNYAAEEVTATLTIAKADQAISFEPISAKTFGDLDFTLQATGGASANAVTYTSSNTSVATIENGTVHIVGAGATTITASQEGNNNYNAAADVNQVLVVNTATATISLTELTHVYNGSPKSAIAVTSPEGLPGVSITYNGSTDAPMIAGTYLIEAKLVNPNYTATDANASFTISKAHQVISFVSIGVKTYGDEDFGLIANGGVSGSPVTYTSSNPEVATIIGGSVHIVGAGVTNITASQAGNANFNAAGDVVQSVLVNPATASITLSSLDQVYDGSAKAATTTTNPVGLSGVEVTYNGLPFAPTNAGSYNVVAKLLNPNYTLVETQGTLSVTKADQAITFATLAAKTFGDTDFALTATGGASGNEVTYTSSNTNVATVVSGNIHIVGAGTTAITASQAGNGNYNAAADISQTLTVNQATASISIAGLTHVYDGSAKAAIVTTSPEGLAGVSINYNGFPAEPVAAGSYSVLAKLVNPNYTTVLANENLVISKAAQSIAFAPLPAKTFGDADFALTATGGASGIGVIYTSSNTNVATVVGGNIHIVSAGTTVITASQAGNDNYNAAADVSQTLVVNQAAAAISITGLTHVYDGSAKSAATTTTPEGLTGLSVTYNGSAAAPLAAGNYAVAAKLVNPDYTAQDASATLTIAKADQLIIFAPLAEKTFGDADFALTATGGASGSGVIYTSSNTNVATVVSGNIQIVGAGTTTITASQAGNDNYNAAVDVAQTLTVNQATASISIAGLTHVYNGSAKAVIVTTNPEGLAGLSVTYNGSPAEPVAAGTYSVLAKLVNPNYTTVLANENLLISKAAQSITFAPLTAKTYGDADFALTATGGASGSGVIYTSSNTNVATVVGGNIHIVGAGTTIITASQAGNDNYKASADVTQTLVVNQAAATISLAGLTHVYDGSAKLAIATTNPEGLTGLSVTYNGSAAAPLAAGSYAVTAKLVNPDYTAQDASATLTIAKADQLIIFAPLAAKTFGDADFALTATGGPSGSPVIYTSSNTEVATVVFGTVQITGAGTTTITAAQAGNANFNAAANVSQVLIVNKGIAIIAISSATYQYDATAKTLNATTLPAGLTGLSFTYNGLAIAPSAAGVYNVDASLTNPNYNAAPATATLTIVAPITAGLKVQYRNADTNPANNESKPFFKIVNNAQSAAPYNQLTMRYWITPENYTGAMGLFVDYAQIGASKVIMKYVPVANPRVGALGYIEYSFNPSAGSIIGGANSGEIQSRFANTDFTNFDEQNDHSYGSTNSYVDAPMITLYKKGELVWGTEPVVAAPSLLLKVYSQAQTNSANTISTTLDIRNEGNVAVDFKDLKARYWFTPDGTSALKFTVDFAKVGNSAITGGFVTPGQLRVNGGTYLEVQVKPTNTNFYPLTSTGNIQYRINKNDWTNFNQTNDYSYVTGALAANPKITLYHKGVLVYGTEPAIAGPSVMMANNAAALKEASASTPSFGIPESQGIIVYPNPSSGNFTLQMNDVQDGIFTVLIHNETGKVLNSYSGNKSGDFRKIYQLDLPKGMYYMVITFKDHKEYRTILIDKADTR